MNPKILLVDDEPSVLAGYERTLHRDFQVETASGGVLGLRALTERGPYAVVVSDMRMPGMTGAQFLAESRRLRPATVRMLLTGYTDLNAAIEAVNEGNIFRFLTKPCAKEVLTAALNAGVEQYRLIGAEKDLLEKTLMGSIRALADLLQASNPEAFARSMRIVHCVRHISRHFEFTSGWQLDGAAMLSQLGCATLDPELLEAAFLGARLTPQNQARFDAHPEAAVRLLSGIPRLEPVAWMIGQQRKQELSIERPRGSAEQEREMVLGAKVLKLAVAFDELRINLSEEETILGLRERRAEFDLEMVDALHGFLPVGGRMELRTIAVVKLAPGMILHHEIRHRNGMLIAAKDQEVTQAILIRLENFAHAGSIDSHVMVMTPVEA